MHTNSRITPYIYTLHKHRLERVERRRADDCGWHTKVQAKVHTSTLFATAWYKTAAAEFSSTLQHTIKLAISSPLCPWVAPAGDCRAVYKICVFSSAARFCMLLHVLDCPSIVHVHLRWWLCLTMYMGTMLTLVTACACLPCSCAQYHTVEVRRFDQDCRI